MLRFYYTGANKFLDPQPKASLSIGKYISNSLVSNDVFSNLFGEISSFTVSKNRPEYAILALKNETGSDLTDIQVYYNYDTDNYGKLEIAAVAPMTDACGDKSFESIPDKNAKPIMASFVEANGVANTVSLGPVASGEYIGIWFKRTLTELGAKSAPSRGKFNLPSDSINSCDKLYERYLNDNEELATEENIEFVIEY